MRRYGKWAGNERGVAEDPKRCVVQVHSTGRSWVPAQCGRPRGHGPEGLYCKQHARMAEEGRLSGWAVPDDESATGGTT